MCPPNPLVVEVAAGLESSPALKGTSDSSPPPSSCISSRRFSNISTSISFRTFDAFSLNAWEVLSLAFSSPISCHTLFFIGSLIRNRPGGSILRISCTMEEAISRFSRLNRAVR